MNHRIVLTTGGVLCGLSVILGAFAAHGLKGYLPENLLSAFQTGVQYQFFHGLALLLISILAKQYPQRSWSVSANLLLAGVICFSGSLYLMALTGIKWMAFITPIGGVLFVLGWLTLVITSTKIGANT